MNSNILQIHHLPHILHAIPATQTHQGSRYLFVHTVQHPQYVHQQLCMHGSFYKEVLQVFIHQDVRDMCRRIKKCDITDRNDYSGCIALVG